MRLIPLQIALDYPISWNFKKILRDLIQNFYDSIGYKNFEKEFVYTWKEDSRGYIDIEMKTYGHPFSYEWLTYIGGSSKTGKPGDYIGMYGEGFKMCMLCLYNRDDYSPTMESQNWIIKPVSYNETIDDKTIPMLGYNYQEREDDGWTRLTLHNIPPCYIQDIEEAMLNFFYPENPLIGKMIFDNGVYSIYERTKMKIPCAQNIPDFNGILFCNFLARGRLPFNLIILQRKDMRKTDSRKREVLNNLSIKYSIIRMCNELTPKLSYQFLEKMKNFWNDLPQRSADLETWYYVICTLVRNIAKDQTLRKKFLKQYPNLVYIERKSSDISRNKLINETKVWAQNMNDIVMVNPIFRLLGAKSLIEEYLHEKETFFRNPSEKERKYIEILFNATLEVFPCCIFEPIPDVVIQDKRHSKDLQSLFLTSSTDGTKQVLLQKYRIQKVIMKANDFEPGKFFDSFIKFTDILIHAFGKDRSENVNFMLTYLAECCIKKGETLRKYEVLWNA